MIRSLIGYYGGKNRMAKYIIDYIPSNTKIYVEVFGGGGSVLINKPESEIEVYNDIRTGLTSLFRCMTDINRAKELQKRIFNVPYNEDVFLACKGKCDAHPDEMTRAIMTYVVVMQSFNSAMNSWRKPTPDVLRSYERKIMQILDFVPRFKNVIIENKSFEEILEKYDGPDTLFYLDPPYITETRSKGAKNVYKYEFQDLDHELMVDILLNIKGKAIVSGYDHDRYSRISTGKWNKIHLGNFPKSSQKTKKGGRKTEGTEYIWINY